jgi:hypothetical protein
MALIIVCAEFAKQRHINLEKELGFVKGKKGPLTVDYCYYSGGEYMHIEKDDEICIQVTEEQDLCLEITINRACLADYVVPLIESPHVFPHFVGQTFESIMYAHTNKETRREFSPDYTELQQFLSCVHPTSHDTQ